MDELGYLLKKDALGLSFLYVVACVAWGLRSRAGMVTTCLPPIGSATLTLDLQILLQQSHLITRLPENIMR
jgi:hypothetical protein